MGKLRRGGYIFITYKGDHAPLHVHIYRDAKEIAKWNIQDWVIMSGAVNSKILKLLKELMKEGKL